MSLFQCEVCGCRENTALACQGFKELTGYFDWSYAPERKGLMLCSACGPVKSRVDGSPTKYGVWHGVFPRLFLPKGQFITNREGNLEHAATGRTDIESFAITPGGPETGVPAWPAWLAPWMADQEAIEGCLEWAKAEVQTVNVGECECLGHDTVLQSSAGWVTKLLTAMLEASRKQEKL